MGTCRPKARRKLEGSLFTPPCGTGLIALCKNLQEPVFSCHFVAKSCKKTQDAPPETQSVQPICFQSGLRSFSLFSCKSFVCLTYAKQRGVYTPSASSKSKVLLEVGQLTPTPPYIYSEHSVPRPRHSSKPQSLFSDQRINSIPFLSSTSALFFTLSNLLFHVNRLSSSNCALFCKKTRGGGSLRLFASNSCYIPSHAGGAGSRSGRPLSAAACTRAEDPRLSDRAARNRYPGPDAHRGHRQHLFQRIAVARAPRPAQTRCGPSKFAASTKPLFRFSGVL